MRIRSLGITSLVAASVAIVFIACTPEATAPADIGPAALTLDRKVKDLEERYGWIGQYHTDGLEYVYAELARSDGRKDTKALCKTIDKAVREFHKIARKGEIPFHLMDASVFAGPCDDLKSERGPSENILTGSPRISADEVSPLTMSYIDQIQTAIFSATTKPALVSALHGIQNAAVATLPSGEAGVVVGTVSVVFSSMEYWEANLESWINLGAGPGIAYSISAESPAPVSASTFNWPRAWDNPYTRAFKKVVAADGIAAARTLYMTWRLGPIGWDAAAAAGVFGSITTAISLQF